MRIRSQEEAQRFAKRITELRARRNKLFMLGLTLSRDMVAFDEMMAISNDDTKTPDDLLDFMEKHVAQMEAEFMS